MAKSKKKEVLAEEVPLLDKVTGYKSKRGRRRGDPTKALFQWRERFREVLQTAVDRGITVIQVRAVVGTLSKESFFDNVAPDKRYRRSYNYFEQSRDHIPPNWEMDRVHGYACLVYKDLELED